MTEFGSGVPGPPPYRGRVTSTAQLVKLMMDPLGYVNHRFDTYGDIFCEISPQGRHVSVRHPDHIRDVLLTHASKYSKNHSALVRMKRILGNGLLNSDGEEWKLHRRMLQPAFHASRLRLYFEVMTDETERLLASWRDGQEEDINAAMRELVLRIVCRTLFGYGPSDNVAELGHLLSTAAQESVRPDPLPPWMPSLWRRRFVEVRRQLDEHIAAVIQTRRAEIAEGHDSSRPADLLQMILTAKDEDSGHGLTDREIRDHAVTFFIGGHETTFQTLSWTFYLLSQHREAERALHAELHEVLGGRTPTFEDLGKLTYTEMVLKETMRLYPQAYAVCRKAEEDTEIGGYPVPAGSEVMLWIYMTHRDPRWYEQPDAFIPERFAESEQAKLNKLAYLPFGAGPRVCMGQYFAMTDTKLILAMLAQRFRFRVAPKHRVAMQVGVSLVPKNGMPMTLHAR